ncbi:insulin-like growth factor-binding protein-like 1 isoform X2 [Ornithorhynchus anatinus]|uniref:insulin-like growth factor-binding protein-like 1 isoform X2 n=1 Tax=Ornithorhynchus anatinus TaxID=9258 RepID=UPI0019D4D238|nr:insulin-like growth factor-binding protein-like 1 isoform X2 [Ornithorhynchus anatinus]
MAPPARSLPLLLLLLLLPLCLLPRRSVGAAGGVPCGPCRPDRCEPAPCPAAELTVRDVCGCCERCLGAEGERCGGRAGRRARCGPRLVCVGLSRPGPGAAVPPPAELEGTGRCVCEEEGAVCGSDGRSYGSVCALHLHSALAREAGRDRIHKVHDGECKFAPVIVMPPKKIHNVTGAQVYLSCEVKAVPTPLITWRKINPLTKEDEGVYQCHATNMEGETQSEGAIKVMDQSKYKRTNFIDTDDDI